MCEPRCCSPAEEAGSGLGLWIFGASVVGAIALVAGLTGHLMFAAWIFGGAIAGETAFALRQIWKAQRRRARRGRRLAGTVVYPVRQERPRLVYQRSESLEIELEGELPALRPRGPLALEAAGPGAGLAETELLRAIEEGRR